MTSVDTYMYRYDFLRAQIRPEKIILLALKSFYHDVQYRFCLLIPYVLRICECLARDQSADTQMKN